jgi:deoxyribonuclease-4
MVEIRFGPSGIGGKTDAIDNLELFSKIGLRACEIAFTYGVYFDKKIAEEVGKKAKELDINLSIHAPYYVNLNSSEKAKIVASKKRILDCCEIGNILSSGDSKRKTKIVFHAGFYGKNMEEAFGIIKKNIVDLMGIIKEKNWNVILCPEVMGKRNVFGSIDEISQLIKETGCSCCIDFAHILARYDKYEFELARQKFENLKSWHCHFSGIVYGDKGEKHHIHTEEKEWRQLFDFLRGIDKEITIVSEAPDPSGDAKEGLEMWKGHYFLLI